MNLQSAVQRIRKIIIPMLNGTKMKCPVPVWDSTGTKIGVELTAPVDMGGKPCTNIATFVLDATDSDAMIRFKAGAAIAAMDAQVIVHIRPVKQEKAA